MLWDKVSKSAFSFALDTDSLKVYRYQKNVFLRKKPTFQLERFQIYLLLLVYRGLKNLCSGTKIPKLQFLLHQTQISWKFTGTRKTFSCAISQLFKFNVLFLKNIKKTRSLSDSKEDFLFFRKKGKRWIVSFCAKSSFFNEKNLIFQQTLDLL